MIRALLRLVLLVIIVAAIAAFFVGYRFAGRDTARQTQDAVGTTGGQTVGHDRGTIDLDRARQTGARLGEGVAAGANRAGRFARDAGLTAKIASKMALDDLVKARAIDVDTVDGVVTLRGVVGSAAERDRALQLARETEGVSTVTDLLTVGR